MFLCQPPLTFRFIPAAHHHHHHHYYLLPRLPSHQPPPLEPSATEHSGLKPTKSVHHHPHTDIVPATQRSCLSIPPLFILACRQDWTGGNPLKKTKTKQNQNKKSFFNDCRFTCQWVFSFLFFMSNCCTPLPRTFKLRVPRHLMPVCYVSTTVSQPLLLLFLFIFFFPFVHFIFFISTHKTCGSRMAFSHANLHWQNLRF